MRDGSDVTDLSVSPSLRLSVSPSLRLSVSPSLRLSVYFFTRLPMQSKNLSVRTKSCPSETAMVLRQKPSF